MEEFYRDKTGYHRKRCRNCASALYRKYVEKDPNKYKKYGQEYRAKNRQKIAAYMSAYKKAHQKTKDQTDPRFRIRRRLSTRLRTAIKIKGGKKNKKTMELLGCTIEHMMEHLESLFQPGMTWETYGFRGWHIDHIKPCASFDLTDPEQQKLCFHWTNLQPLWAIDNLKKSDKYEPS